MKPHHHHTKMDESVATFISYVFMFLVGMSAPLFVGVDFAAMALYYQGNNNQQSKENNKKAKDVLERDWKDRIHDGQFIVYTYAEQNGEKAVGANAVHTILQTIVLTRFRHVFDFAKGLTETQLKLTQANKVSRQGIDNGAVTGLIAGCEKNILSKVWSRAEYWTAAELADAVSEEE